MSSFLNRRGVVTVYAILSMLFLSACNDKNSWNQKTVLAVETPAGIVTAASFGQVAYNFGTHWPSGNEVSYGYKGEAVVLQLQNGKYLFALIEGDREAERFFRALYDSYSDRGEKLRKIARMQGESRVLARDNYPLLVTFDDINDPASVKRVDPDNLAASFGPGYTLKTITLEITDEPVTAGKVEEVLGWLKETGRRAGGLTPLPKGKKTSDYPDPQVQFLGPAAFSTEWNK